MTSPFRTDRSSSYPGAVEGSNEVTTGTDHPVAVLFEELGETLDLIITSAQHGEEARLFEYRANAQAILSGLDKKLNFEVAGDLAQTLRLIYVEAAKRIQHEGKESCVERIESAREMISEVEKAWTKIVTLN